MRSRWTRWSSQRRTNYRSSVSQTAAAVPVHPLVGHLILATGQSGAVCQEEGVSLRTIEVVSIEPTPIHRISTYSYNTDSLLLPPQWRRGWQPLCEHFAAGCCDQQGVLKLSRALAVGCRCSPPVRPCDVLVAAHIHHWLNGEDLPLLHGPNGLQIRPAANS